MGCAVSTPRHEAHKPWPLRDEATRVFKLADEDHDGYLSFEELKMTLRNQAYAETTMKNLDVIDHDGRVSLTEWLAAQKMTCDKSQVGATLRAPVSVDADSYLYLARLCAACAVCADGVQDGAQDDREGVDAKPREPGIPQYMMTAPSGATSQPHPEPPWDPLGAQHRRCLLYTSPSPRDS